MECKNISDDHLHEKNKNYFRVKNGSRLISSNCRKIAARRTNIKMCEEKCKFHHPVCFTPRFASRRDARTICSHVDRHHIPVNIKHSRNTKCLPCILYSVVWPFSIWHKFYFYSELLIFLFCNSLMTWHKLYIHYWFVVII